MRSLPTATCYRVSFRSGSAACSTSGTHSFLAEHPDLVQYLYQLIKDIVYFLK